MTGACKTSKQRIGFLLLLVGLIKASLTPGRNPAREVKLLRRGLAKAEKEISERLADLQCGTQEEMPKFHESTSDSAVSRIGEKPSSSSQPLVDQKPKDLLNSSSQQKFEEFNSNFILQTRTFELGTSGEQPIMSWNFFKSKGKDGWKNDRALLTHWRAIGFSHVQKEMATVMGDILEVWSSIYLMNPKVPEPLKSGRFSARQSTALRYQAMLDSFHNLESSDEDLMKFKKVISWYKTLMGPRTVEERLNILTSEATSASAQIPSQLKVYKWKSELLHKHPEMIEESKKEYSLVYLSFLQQQLSKKLTEAEESIIHQELIFNALQSDQVWNFPDTVLILRIYSSLELCRENPTVKEFLSSSILVKMRKNQIERIAKMYIKEWRQVILALEMQLPAGKLDDRLLTRFCVLVEAAQSLESGSMEKVWDIFKIYDITQDLIEELSKHGYYAIGTYAMDNFKELSLMILSPSLPANKIQPTIALQQYFGALPTLQKQLRLEIAEDFWHNSRDYVGFEYVLMCKEADILKNRVEKYYREVPERSLDLDIPATELLVYRAAFLDLSRIFQKYPEILDKMLTTVQADVGKKNVRLTESIIEEAIQQRKMKKVWGDLKAGNLGIKNGEVELEPLLEIGKILKLDVEYFTFDQRKYLQRADRLNNISKEYKDLAASVLGKPYLEREALLYMSARLATPRPLDDLHLEVLVRRLMAPNQVKTLYRQGISPTKRVALLVVSASIKQEKPMTVHDLYFQWGITQELLKSLLEEFRAPGWKESLDYSSFFEDLEEPKHSYEEIREFLEKIWQKK